MLIAFTGKAGSGKSSAVTVVKSIDGNVVALRKFADPLYQIQEFVYRLISPVYQRPDDFVKDRFFLQFLGTEWGRNKIKTSLWIELWKHAVDKVKARDPQVIIICDDCRYDNEAIAIMEMGGYVVAIDRAECSPQGGAGIENHFSEDGISPYLIDYRIPNNGTMEEFREALIKLMNEIKAADGRENPAA